MDAASSTGITFYIASAAQLFHATRLELCFVVLFFAFVLLNPRALSKASTPPKAPKVADKGPGQGRGGGRENEGSIRRRPATADATDDAAARPGRDRCSDEVWFAKNVAHHSQKQVQKVVELYKSATKSGMDLSLLPAHKGQQLFVDLVTAAIRANQPKTALDMLRVCRKSGFNITQELLSSATKLCTSKQFYMESLAMYDFASQDKTLDIVDRSVWSCLLFCSVETHALKRCMGFWKKINECGSASSKDFGNLVRYASKQCDWQFTLSLVNEMREKGVEFDNVIYNTALSTYVSAGCIDEAQELLKEMEGCEGIVDVITYNTLAKGYAKLGRLQDCFDLFEHMRTRGIVHSQVSYGILLDCCINEKHLDRALDVFRDMVKDGCVMNTVLYTMLIKGFARERQVEQAMQIYRSMLEDDTEGVSPDRITFSILIKVHCDTGRLSEAQDLLDKMTALNLVADEGVFNTLLGACVQRGDAKLARHFLDQMIEYGLKPSTSTFSIMIRVYMSCKLADEAVEMLRTVPPRAGIEIEPRLLVQLAQGCLRERQGRTAIEAYKVLVSRVLPTPVMTGSLLAMCAKLNMVGTGVELLQLAAQAGAHVGAKDIMDLRQQATKKHKDHLVQQLDVCAAFVRVRPAAGEHHAERS